MESVDSTETIESTGLTAYSKVFDSSGVQVNAVEPETLN